MIATTTQPSSKTRFEYRVAAGAHITQEQAQPLFKVIAGKFRGERPTPEKLIEEARRKTSPINHLFDWNKVRAAEAHWRARAQYYLRHIDVIEVNIKTETIVRGPVRFAMPKTYDADSPLKVIEYKPTQRLGSGEPISVVLDRARRDFRSWVARYSRYVEFLDMFDPLIRKFEALEAELDTVKPRPKRKRGR